MLTSEWKTGTRKFWQSIVWAVFCSFAGGWINERKIQVKHIVEILAENKIYIANAS